MNLLKDKWLLCAATLIALLAPKFVGPYGHYILVIILIYALVCMGLNVLMGMGGQISIGHAAFWAIGAYTSAVLVSKFGMPLLMGVLAGGVLALAAGLLVALPALRVQGHYLAIATLGFALVVHQILYEWDAVTGGRSGMLVPRPNVLGFDLSNDSSYYYMVLGVTMLAAWITRNFRNSLDGLGLIALRMSPTGSQVMGIGRARNLFVAFGLSAFLTGVSGALFGHLIGQLSTDSFTLTVSLSFMTAAIVGGTSSVAGAVLGGLFLALAPELLRSLKDAQNIVYGGILIVFMHFLPGGLVSLPQRIAGLRRRAVAEDPKVKQAEAALADTRSAT